MPSSASTSKSRSRPQSGEHPAQLPGFRSAQRAGPDRDGCAGDHVLADWYLRDGLSAREIAERLEVSQATATRRLRRLGVDVAPRGTGRERPRRRRADPPGLAADLAELYVQQRLPSSVVAEKLGLPERLVRNRLHQLDIPTRSRGWANREDRQRLAAEPLQNLYVAARLTAGEVGKKLGRSRREVLYSAHDLDIPVRPGGTNINPTRAIQVLSSLYADPLVGRTLRRHGMPIVTSPGSLHVRFPRPAPLSPELLRDLYLGCGLAVFHIELLTGQPAATIGRHMAGIGLPRRPPGGLSPFVRRQRGLDRPQHKTRRPHSATLRGHA